MYFKIAEKVNKDQTIKHNNQFCYFLNIILSRRRPSSILVISAHFVFLSKSPQGTQLDGLGRMSHKTSDGIDTFLHTTVNIG